MNIAVKTLLSPEASTNTVDIEVDYEAVFGSWEGKLIKAGICLENIFKEEKIEKLLGSRLLELKNKPDLSFIEQIEMDIRQQIHDSRILFIIYSLPIPPLPLPPGSRPLLVAGLVKLYITAALEINKRTYGHLDAAIEESEK